MIEEKDDFLVAVYGTLRSGHGNHSRLLKDNSELLGETKLKNFEMRSLGGFPAIKHKEGRDVVAEVFKVNKDTLTRLDWLEGYPSFYDREKTETPFGEAWVYFIDRSSGREEIIDHGDWNKFIAERNV